MSHPQVLTVSQLDENALHKLFNNEICIIRVPNFCSKDLCLQLSQWFKSNEKLTSYPYIMKQQDGVKSIYYGVDRVGVPYNSTYGNLEQKKKYYEEALSGIRALRSASNPYLSPIDKIRVELDENWCKGANVANFEGKKMFIGIGRLMQASTSYMTELQPHCDSVPKDYANLMGQFSANTYLSIPENGGELEIWDVPPLPTNIIHESDPDRDWRAELPESIVLQPKQGDLLLFNTRRPHAIRRFGDGIRITSQCFIGLNQDGSLSMWT